MKLTDKEKYEAVKEVLDNLRESELFWVHCNYCDERQYSDDRAYSMCEFDDLMSERSPLEIAQDINGTNFSPNDEYFWFNGYGNLCSGSVYDFVDTDDIAHYMVDEENALDCDDVQDLFDEWEEQEEDEDEEDEEE